ncbi:ribbon-helix-helix protein, CopG family [Shewanella algae]
MHKNIKEKLDKLSKKQNLPRNEIIEELINKAYKDLKEVK